MEFAFKNGVRRERAGRRGGPRPAICWLLKLGDGDMDFHYTLFLYMFENLCNKKGRRSIIILLTAYLIKEKISAHHSSYLCKELSI